MAKSNHFIMPYDYPGIVYREFDPNGSDKLCKVYDEDGDHVGTWLTTEHAGRVLDALREYSRSVAYAVAVGHCSWCLRPGFEDDPLGSLDLVPAPTDMHSLCAESYVAAGATFPSER